MWTYNQASGVLSKGGAVIATGYSGFAAGKNNPTMQREPNLGPVPAGTYEIGQEFQSTQHGIVCMHLSPKEGTETYGRGGFLIHGDSIQHPGSASHGCIILSRDARILIAMSDDRELEVV